MNMASCVDHESYSSTEENLATLLESAKTTQEYKESSSKFGQWLFDTFHFLYQQHANNAGVTDLYSPDEKMLKFFAILARG